MNAEFGGETERGYGVRVYDNDGHEHKLAIDKEGNILGHFTDDYPPDEDDLTDEQEIIIQQVRKKAMYTAHTETDADLLEPHWDPAVHERGIAALERMPADRFERLFAELYEALQQAPEGVALQQIDLVVLGLSLEDTEITDVGPIQYYIETDAGKQAWVGPKDEVYREVIFTLPMYEFDWPFGERFRKFLVHHLKCKIRDIYLNMGDEPPEAYQVDGHGKVVLNAFPAEMPDRDV